jgi:hypothetical protein
MVTKGGYQTLGVGRESATFSNYTTYGFNFSIIDHYLLDNYAAARISDS